MRCRLIRGKQTPVAPVCHPLRLPGSIPKSIVRGYHAEVIDFRYRQETRLVPEYGVPEGVHEMASNIKHRVEPLFGWLFLVVVFAALGAAIYVATQPMVDVTSHLDIQHTR
jgi:hypothetical protein